jgi:hypothetical protein
MRWHPINLGEQQRHDRLEVLLEGHEARDVPHHGRGAFGGRYDSFDGNEPTTMSTCLDEDTFAWSNVFEQDGHAYENWLWSDLPERQLHANIGFEQGSRFWGFSGGGFVEEHSTGGATGPGYIGWVSPGPSAYVYQTVRTEVGNLSNDVVYEAWRMLRLEVATGTLKSALNFGEEQ